MAGINFKLLFDNTEFKQKVEEAKIYLSSIGQGGIDTSALQQSTQSLGQAIENSMSRADAVFSSFLSNSEEAVDITSMLGDSFNEVSQTVEAMNSSIETQEGVISELSSQYDVLSTAREQANTSGDTAKVDSLTESMQSLKTQINEERNALQGMKGAMSQATAQMQAMGQTAQQTGSINMTEQLEQGLSLLPQPLQGAINGIRGMGRAMKALIANPLGAFITAVVIAFTALYKAMNSTEEKQIRFAKYTGYLSGMLDQLMQLLTDLGDVFIQFGDWGRKAFENPQEALKDFVGLIKSQVEVRLKAIIKTFGALGTIVAGIFTGSISEVKQGLKEYANATAEGITGVQDAGYKAVAKVKEMNDKAVAQANLKRQEKQLEQDISKWQERKAELENLKAQAQTLMYDTNGDPKKRKKALDEYKALIKEELDTELAFQDRKIAIIHATNQLTDSDHEAEDKERKARAEKIKLQAKANRELAMLARRSGGINNAGKKQNKEAEQEKKALEDYQKQIKASVQKGEFELEALRIEAMKDGFAKRQAQARLNHKQALAEVERMKSEMFNAYAERNKKQVADVKIQDLSADEQKALGQAVEKANKQLAQAEEANFKSVLGEVKTYQQQRLELEQEFAEKRNALYRTDEQGTKILKKGVSQGNVDELNRKEEEALGKIDEQFASRSEEYKAWTSEIAKISLEQLQVTLEQAEAELKQFQEKGGGDPQKQAVALAKVRTLKNKIAGERAKSELNPKARTIKEWQDLHRTLNECTKSFKEMGEAVGGTTGKILQTAGEIAGSTLGMINSIMQLATMSATAISTTATAGAKAVNMVEKASVILAVISTALQLATKIASLFDNSGSKDKQIKHLQGEIDQLEWELNHKDITQLIERKGRAIDFVNQVMAETVQELYQQTLATEGAFSAFNKVSQAFKKDSPTMQKAVGRIADEFGKIEYSAGKALGTDKYKQARGDLENMAQQQIHLQEQINAEKSKKSSKQDSKKIKEAEQKIEELRGRMAEVTNKLVEDIIGGSSEKIAEQLGNAFIEAFQKGEDGAKAWGDKVNDIINDITKRMLIKQFLSKPIAEAVDEFKKGTFDKGKYKGDEALHIAKEKLRLKLVDAKEQMEKINFQEFGLTQDPEREGSRGRGIATASQESVDELNGRATAIQSHTYSISEMTKLLVANTNNILKSVQGIETNTQKLHAMESNLSDLKDTVSDIALKGVRIRD